MALRFDGVRFGYRRRDPIFDELSFESSPGVTVLLGPNGAGKTTMIGLGASVLRPDSGTVSVDGVASDSRAVRSKYRRWVGWVPQQIDVVPGFSVREQVAYCGWLKGASRRAAWTAASEAVRRVDLTEHVNRPVAQLSGGQLRRVGIAQVLVHDARIVLMDEPTAGLDPAQRAGFRTAVRALGGATHVVVSTHQTEDLPDVADRVLVLSAGSLLWDGTPQELLERGGSQGSATTRIEAAYRGIVG